MNNGIQPIDYVGLSDIFPDIFSQIIDGVKEQRSYQTKIGTLYITLSDEKGQYEPKISHVGAWSFLDLATKVREFFKVVNFSSFFNSVKHDCERTLLKKVFSQIVSGTETMEYTENHGMTVNVQITKKVSGLCFMIDVKKKDEGLNDCTLKDPTSLLNNFLLTQNISSYFGIRKP